LVWWQNSSLHNSIMLNSKYTEVGAGVATNGDSVYFTAVLGGPSGGSSSSGSGFTSGSGDSENTQTTQSAPIVMSVQKATAQPDGSIIHTVLTGQTLWTIAAVYQVELNKLLELNGLNQYSYVFPGDQIIVRPAGQYQDQETTLTTTLNPSLSGTPDPQNKSQVIGEAFSYQDTTPTPVSPTSTPVVVRINRAPTLVPEDSRNLIDDPVVRNLIIAALIILIIVMVVSSFIQKPATRPPKDEQLD
jgi:LysM repeat protein